MAVVTLTLAAGSTASVPQTLPMAYQPWQGMGMSALVNFTSGGGSGNVTLQVSNDPNAAPSNSGNASARWNNHDVLYSLTAAKNDSLAYPCRYVRLIGNVTAGSVSCDIGYADPSSPSQ